MSKRLLRSKRGMAMESAILFMLIIFSLCALLSAVTLTGHYQNKLEQQLLKNKTEIDQFGEWFLAGALQFDDKGEGKRNGYRYYRTDTVITLGEAKEEVTTGETTTTPKAKQISTNFYLTKEDSYTVLLHIMTVTTTTTTTTTTVQTDENGETSETSTETTSTQTTLLSWLYSGTLPTITDNSQD